MNSTWLRKNIKVKNVQRFMFTDEKVFTIEGCFNPKNDGIWSDDRSSANMEGGIFEKEKYSIIIMVALGATWNDLTLPYIKEPGKTITTAEYLKILIHYKKEGRRLFCNDS